MRKDERLLETYLKTYLETYLKTKRLFEKSEIDVFLRFFALIPAFSQREKEPETAKHLPSSPSGRGLR
jgi:hypothetical protein